MIEVKIDRPYEPAHRATEGHFAAHPIIPGVVILADVMRAIRDHFAAEDIASGHACTIRAAKFLRPVLPGQTMTIRLKIAASTATPDARKQAVSFECSVAETVVAKGALDFYG